MRTTLVALTLLIYLSIHVITFAGETLVLGRGPSPQHPQQPQVAVDAKGAIHVVFGVGDEIRYCRSDDGGTSFSKPLALRPVHAMSLGMRRGPRIAVTDSTICVTAIGGKQGKGRDGDLLALHSTNGGKSWSEPVAVNDTADAAREGLHAMSAGPKDSVCCVWLDLRSSQTELMASVSRNGGKTWNKNTLVYRSPDGSVCECCHPSVAIDALGRIFVQWRNSLAGARDMFVAFSADGGDTFSEAAKQGSGSWLLAACPMDGGAICTPAPGKTAAVWRRENAVYLWFEGERDERRLGIGEQPWIAAAANGLYVVWLRERGNAALLLSPGASSPAELAVNASDPVIASRPDGRGPVVVVWEVHEGNEYTIRCQVVANIK